MPDTSTDLALLIFVRNPELGKVKTRLARDTGDEQALRIYLALLAHTRQAALAVDAHRYLFYSNFIDREDDWPNSDFVKHLQPSGDLGRRMLQAFELALQQHHKAVIIGSDCPQLSSELIQQAFSKLDQHEVVIGPAEDGGYYLLGMQKVYPELFLDMTWSTANVLTQTTARLKQSNTSYALLDTLSDIDYLADWQQHGWPLD